MTTKARKGKQPAARADIHDADALHGALFRSMADELERCRKAGEAPAPALLQCVRQLLKDNGVDHPAHSSRVDRLRGALPDMDDLEGSANVVPLRGAQ